MSTLAQATEFVLTSASETDLERLAAALKDRRRALADIRAAAVAVGARVTTQNLSPKYLNGLTGTVKSIRNKHAYLHLDEESTGELRWQMSRRFPVPEGVTTYSLPAGIPLTCLKATPADSSASA